MNAYRAALRHLRPRLAVAGGFSAVINLLMLTGSIYMLQIYDRVLSSGSVATLLGLFAIVVVLHVFLGCFDFLRLRFLGRAAIRLDRLTGAAGFRAWLRSGIAGRAAAETRREPGLNAGTGAGTGAGAAPLRDLETVRGFLSGPGAPALFDIPWVPIYLTVLFVIHPWLGWLTVAGAGIVVLLALVNRAATQGAIGDAAALEGEERDFAERSRRNAETLLPMGMEPVLIARWRALHDRALARTQSGTEPSETIAAGSRAFRLLLQSAILTLGAWLVLGGEISAGMIIAASILSGRALAPVDQAIAQWRGIGRAVAAHRRLDAFFADLAPAPARIDLPRPRGALTVSRLTKHAPGRAAQDETRILDRVGFRLEPGDGLGVIGSSAAGKSTLARLLVGAWTPDGGEIRLDGATLEQWDPAVLGRAIGYLPQHMELMPGTIRDNIARFDPAAGDESVIAAARLAGVHEMILKLPEGYATRIGNGSGEVQLSGGQLQRIALARAVHGMPHLVVLDEPNANLDTEGDAALTRAIAALRAAGSLVVVVAHRPGALGALNKVLVLDEGRVTAFGAKEEALAQIQGRAEAAATATPPAAPKAQPEAQPEAQPGTLPAAPVRAAGPLPPRLAEKVAAKVAAAAGIALADHVAASRDSARATALRTGQEIGHGAGHGAGPAAAPETGAETGTVSATGRGGAVIALRPAAGGRPETRAARPARPACGASAPRPDATPALTRSPAP